MDEPERERLQGKKDVPQQLPGLRVDEVAVVVELALRMARRDEPLRLVDEVDVEEDPDLPDVVRRPLAAGLP